MRNELKFSLLNFKRIWLFLVTFKSEGSFFGVLDFESSHFVHAQISPPVLTKTFLFMVQVSDVEFYEQLLHCAMSAFQLMDRIFEAAIGLNKVDNGTLLSPLSMFLSDCMDIFTCNDYIISL